MLASSRPATFRGVIKVGSVVCLVAEGASPDWLGLFPLLNDEFQQFVVRPEISH